MNRAAKPWIFFGVALAGLALQLVSPIAGVVLIGLSAWGGFLTVMAFNVPISRWLYAGIAMVYAVAVYRMSASLPLTLAAFFSIAAEMMPGEIALRSLGTLPLTAARFILSGLALACVALAWPFGLEALALVPTFLLVGMNVMFATMGMPELLSNRPRPKTVTVKVGEPAPDFVLPRRSGDGEFRLSEQRGKHVLLCFLRGDWCPVCQVLMRMYRKASTVLAAHDVKLVMINPSSGEEARAFARDMGMDYEILVDNELTAAKQLGIVSEKNGMNGKPYPLPVSFLVDREGVVRFISGMDDANAVTPERIQLALGAPPTQAAAA